MKDLMAALGNVKEKKAKVEALQEELRRASQEHQVAVLDATKLHDEFTASVADLLPADARKRG